MKLTKNQLNDISYAIKNFKNSGYIPEFKTFMELLNDKTFNNLLRNDCTIDSVIDYLNLNRNRFRFKDIDDKISSNTFTIFYHLGNKGLYEDFHTIVEIEPTNTHRGVKLVLYYKSY